MKAAYWGVLASSLLVLAGCGAAPKTPEAMIDNAKSGGMFSEKESFVVNAPLSKVSAVLKKKAHECLDKGISFTAAGDTSGGIRMDRVESRKLTPKVTVGKSHTRLTVQVKSTGGSMDVGDMPDDGWYFMVVDAYAEGGSKTRVESFYQQSSFHEAFKAIKPWVTGTDSGCPDLTK